MSVGTFWNADDCPMDGSRASQSSLGPCLADVVLKELDQLSFAGKAGPCVRMLHFNSRRGRSRDFRATNVSSGFLSAGCYIWDGGASIHRLQPLFIILPLRNVSLRVKLRDR